MNLVDTWKKLETDLKETLAKDWIIRKNIAFDEIQNIADMELLILKQCFFKINIVLVS